MMKTAGICARREEKSDHQTISFHYNKQYGYNISKKKEKRSKSPQPFADPVATLVSIY